MPEQEYDWRSDDPVEQASEFKQRPVCWVCGKIIWAIIRGVTVIFQGRKQHIPVHPGKCENTARREG